MISHFEILTRRLSSFGVVCLFTSRPLPSQAHPSLCSCLHWTCNSLKARIRSNHWQFGSISRQKTLSIGLQLAKNTSLGSLYAWGTYPIVNPGCKHWLLNSHPGGRPENYLTEVTEVLAEWTASLPRTLDTCSSLICSFCFLFLIWIWEVVSVHPFELS